MEKETTTSKALSLKALTKSSVWDIQENDIFRMLDVAEKDSELKDNLRHFADIIRSAFMIEEVKDDSKPVLERYTKQGYKVGNIKLVRTRRLRGLSRSALSCALLTSLMRIYAISRLLS